MSVFTNFVLLFLYRLVFFFNYDVTQLRLSSAGRLILPSQFTKRLSIYIYFMEYGLYTTERLGFNTIKIENRKVYGTLADY